MLDVKIFQGSTLQWRHNKRDSVSNHLHSSDSSVELIRNNITSGRVFDFIVVSIKFFHKCTNSLIANKAIGHDSLNAKFLKLCGSHIAKPNCNLFNQCVNQSLFPTDMKLAEIRPMFKKNDNLDKENYRSVNILTVMSKVFDYMISGQIISFFLQHPKSCPIRLQKML